MKSKELAEDKKIQELEEKEYEQGYKYLDNEKQHLHTYNGKPLFGTSTVVGVLAKPLTWWASGLAVEKLGWTNSKKRENGKYINIPLESRISHVEPFLEEIKGLSPKEYLNRLDEAYKAHSVKLDDSATAGTDMHALLEEYVKKCITENKRKPMLPKKEDAKPVQIFAEWAVNNVKRFMYSEANCYSHRLWVGGISDVGAELIDGKYAIIDFKSSKEAYESQFIQLAGYAIQIEENGILNANGVLQFKISKPFEKLIIFPFGSENPQAEYRMNLDELKQAFEACTTLHKLLNK